MKLNKHKTKISAFFLAIFMIGTFSIFGTALFIPKKAEACQWLGTGPTCNFTIWDIPRTVEKIVLGIVQRIAINYANKYLTRFIQQVSDKYRIRDFLFYDQYLSDYYLSSLIAKNVSDPNLRSAFNLMNSVYVTGQFQNFCNKAGPNGEKYKTQQQCVAKGGKWYDPRGALLPQLKQKIAQIYIEQGGIDPSKVYYPASTVTDSEYFATAQAYFVNPKSFTEQNIQGQFGAFQSAATTASQLEVTVGNGLKAGRIIGGWCSNQDDSTAWPQALTSTGAKNWDPVSCAAGGGKWNESVVDKARSFISNPASFVERNIDKAFGQIFGSNFDTSNPFTQVGQFLGDFLFSKLELRNSDNVLGDEGYDPNKYGSAASGDTLRRQVDLDEDGIPDGQNNSNPFDANNKLTQPGDTCYHGGIPDKGPSPGVSGCAKSSVLGNTPYFNSFCTAVDEAYVQTNYYTTYIEDHRNSASAGNDVDFKQESDALYWGELGSSVEGVISGLITAVRDLKLGYTFTRNNTRTTGFADGVIQYLNVYYWYMNDIDRSLFADKDLDLHRGGGTSGGSFSNLIQFSEEVRDYLRDLRSKIVDCSQIPNVTPPPVPAEILKLYNGTDSDGRNKDGSGGDTLGQCAADYYGWSNEQWHQLFISLTAQYNQVTRANMAAIEPALFPAQFQRDGSGQLRSRLYLPCSPVNPWGRPVDISTASCEDCGGNWTWIVR